MPRPAPSTLFNYRRYVRVSSTLASRNSLYQTAGNAKVSGTKTYNSDPDFRVKISQKVDATQPYQLSGWMTVTPPVLTGSASLRYRPPPPTLPYTDTIDFSFIESLYPSTALSVPSDAALRDVALNRLKQRLNTSVNRTNQLIPAVELREMRGMIRSLAQESLEVAMKMALVVARSKGKKGRILNSYREQMQRLWLTYSFGIAPTIGAVSDLCNQIEAKLSGSPPALKLSGTASKYWESSSVNQVTGTAFANWRFCSNAMIHHTLSYRYVAGFNPSVLSAENYGAASQFGFGLADLPSVGWELTPFSWMFDYFTNMGAYLEDTFVCPPGFTTYVVLNTKYTAVVDEQVYLKKISNFPGYTTGYADVHSRNGKRQFTYFVRQRLTALPRVGFHLKSTDDIAKGAVFKLLNLISLVKSGGTIVNLSKAK